MIHALIVDDEIHSAEGIRFALDWDSLGVDQVFTANNILAAENILSVQQIHIMITDIEMPKGSGYDLLRWMRDHGQDDTIVIILSSYGTFEYAKQAIEYQCLDYLLKPVSPRALLRAVQRAIGTYFARQSADANNQLAEYWNSNRERRLRNFWRDVLDDAPSLQNTESVIGMASQLHIGYTRESLFLPVLYELHPVVGQVDFHAWVSELCQRLYFQVFMGASVVMVPHNPYIWSIVEIGREGPQVSTARIFQASDAFVEWALEEHGLGISCYLGESGDAGRIVRQFRELEATSQNNVARQSGAFKLFLQKDEIAYVRPDIDAWVGAFARGNYEETIQKASDCLDRMAKNQMIDRNGLHQLLHDFMQAFYIAIDERNIQAHLLFADQHSMAVFEKADSSVSDFKVWICYLVEKAADHIALTADVNSVVGQIKRYVKDHLSEELSRNQIAGSVFMSPDYVSRVFRKETGVQLSEYITDVRMREARRLLETTALSIGEIADQTGYDNLAYFSRVFRIRNRVSPAQYRSSFLAK